MDILIILVYLICTIALISMVLLWVKHNQIIVIVDNNSDLLQAMNKENKKLKETVSHQKLLLTDLENRVKHSIKRNDELLENIEDIYKKQNKYKDK